MVVEKMTRVILIEFAATNRFHRAVLFPYLLGYARRVGVDARWFRLGVPASMRFEQGDRGVGLSPDDRARLAAEVALFGPDAIVFDRWPAMALLDAMETAAPGARLASCGDLGAVPRGVEDRVVALASDIDGWSRFLSVQTGRAAPTIAGLWSVLPDFGYESLNSAAKDMQPLPFVCLGVECTYDRPLHKNPFFDGLDLSASVRAGGCAFCTRQPNTNAATRGRADDAAQQLEALRQTLPAFTGRLAIRLPGEPAFALLETLVDSVVELGFEPCDLLLDSRADRLVRGASRLASVAERLVRTGHRIHVALVGIENFARAELDRMNKGLSPATNLDAVVTLLRLERDHAETFSFREHGGLSMILFTPWSTLEDVAFNLRIVKVGGIDGLCGKLLTARLRLQPELPLAAAARRDGLLIDGYDDPAFDTAARNLYAEELPWRFADRRLEPVCSVLIRMSGDTPFDRADPLAAEVRVLVDSAMRGGLGVLDVALAVVDEAMDASSGPGSELTQAARALIRRAARALAVDDRPGFEGAEHENWEEWADSEAAEAVTGDTHTAETDARFEWRDLLDHLVTLSRAGLKPVVKVEPVRPEDEERWRNDPRLPVVRARRRRTARGPEVLEVFFGAEAAHVDQAIDLAERCQSARDAEAEADATAALGRELGYPACCADAFAYGAGKLLRSDFCWLILSRRLAVPGALPPEMHPCAGTLLASYIPCSADCEASLELVRRELDLGRVRYGPSWVAARHARMANPWLVVLRGQMSALELLPLSDVGPRFRFAAGAQIGAIRELELARRADEIVMDNDGRLLLLCDGALVTDLSAIAWVWWHERAFQVPFWSRLLEIRSYRRPVGLGDVSVGSHGPSMGPSDGGFGAEAAETRALLEAALSEARRGWLPAGITVGPLQPREQAGVAFSLDGGGDQVELVAVRASRDSKYFFRVGPIAFSHPKERPVERPRQHQLVRAFARGLQRAMRAANKAGSGA